MGAIEAIDYTTEVVRILPSLYEFCCLIPSARTISHFWLDRKFGTKIAYFQKKESLTDHLRLMSCKSCPGLSEFTCSTCRIPLCYPCILNLYISNCARADDIPTSCQICMTLFCPVELWTLRRLKFIHTKRPNS